jgi:ferrous iron transport protein B
MTETDLEIDNLNSTTQVLNFKVRAHDLSHKFGPTNDVLLLSQHKLDNFFLSTWGGPVVFVALMLFLFQAIFSWSSPLMDGIDYLISTSGDWVSGLASSPIFADFLKDAIFAGLGSFLVFAPQIFVLFIVIGILEDSGYLARAAVILHKPLSLFGLSGRSFVTMLSGHACAIPAIMAARTIESPRKRLLTIIATPFMSCSARLPVYALLVVAGTNPPTKSA